MEHEIIGDGKTICLKYTPNIEIDRFETVVFTNSKGDKFRIRFDSFDRISINKSSENDSALNINPRSQNDIALS